LKRTIDDLLDKIHQNEIDSLKRDHALELQIANQTTEDNTEDTIKKETTETKRYDLSTILVVIGLVLSIPFAIEGIITIFHL
jgi:Na+(H+)/acetate symporter ActP